MRPTEKGKKGCGVPPPPAPTLSPCADGGADHVWVLPSAKKMAEALLQRPPAGSSAAVSPESISQYLCDKLTIPSASAFRCVSEWGSVLCCVEASGCHDVPGSLAHCVCDGCAMPLFFRHARCSRLLVCVAGGSVDCAGHTVVLRDTLCSCEAYGRRPMYKGGKILFGHGWLCC